MKRLAAAKRRADSWFGFLSYATAVSVSLGLWNWRHGDRGAGWIAALSAVSYGVACAARAWARRAERRAREATQALDATLTDFARAHAGRAKRAGGGDA